MAPLAAHPGAGPVRPQPVAGWGRVPIGRGRVARPERLELAPGDAPLLLRGLGRAYGDAAVPALDGGDVLETTRADRILEFDASSGRLTCEAGLSLDAVVRRFLPRGWFPPVTPGTRFVTVGGCVAADVHGKNHHGAGTFGRFVEGLVMVTAGGRRVACGPDRERELFLATCGGMGLTGLVAEVTVRLQPVQTPWIVMETEGADGLETMVRGLGAASGWPYTVGWIDGLARGRHLGRGILIRGRHATRAEAPAAAPRVVRGPRVPLDAPGWLLNPVLLRAFNALYHASHGAGRHTRLVSVDRFFYPLDAIPDWNRLYGRRGFLQYQCVVPRAAGPAPLAHVLERLAAAGAASFLAVIKDCGAEWAAPLSFPLEGVTLALDLPYRGSVSDRLVHALNEEVARAGGRVYLAKDALTRPEHFAAMAPRLKEWRATRDRWDPARRFRSALSVRLLGDPA